MMIWHEYSTGNSTGNGRIQHTARGTAGVTAENYLIFPLPNVTRGYDGSQHMMNEVLFTYLKQQSPTA